MFERFTREARVVVVGSQAVCRELGADEVGPVHLLAALAAEESGVRAALAEHGLTSGAVRRALGAPRTARAEALDEGDAAALRAVGIDLDAIRAAVERQFGEGALEDAAAREPDARPGRRPRLGRGAKKALELAVREAIRLRAGEIRAEHVALGVLRADDEAVRLLLRKLDVDPRAVRADLEGRGRRSA